MDEHYVPADVPDRQETFGTWIDGKVRQLVVDLAEMALGLEMDVHLQAGWNERSKDRRGYRNGHYRRRLTTPHGPLSVRIPRCRSGGLDCSIFFDRYQRRITDVDRILRHAYLLGVSTRAILPNHARSIPANSSSLAKVAGDLVPVKITAEHRNGGWEAKSVKTGKTIRIKSPQRLRKRIDTARQKDIAKTVQAVEKGNLTKGVTVPAGKKKIAKKTAAKTDHKKRPSGLDAAVAVLAEAKQPLNTKEMVERMLATGLWKTKGKTPAATIYAAIIREISAKGKDARFRKADRGKFELAK